eukprot:1602281-Amphidinium_carterae.1
MTSLDAPAERASNSSSSQVLVWYTKTSSVAHVTTFSLSAEGIWAKTFPVEHVSSPSRFAEGVCSSPDLAYFSGKRPAAEVNASQRPLRPRSPNTSCQSSLTSFECSRSFKTECAHVDHWGG